MVYDEKNRAAEMSKMRWKYRILIISLAIAFIGSGSYLVSYLFSVQKTSSEMKRLVSVKEESKLLSVVNKKKTAMLDFTTLKEKNEHIAGWIEIKNTKIDYPIMQTPLDEQYYLYRNFEKKYNINGLPFMNKNGNFSDEKSNIIIYGHNMKSGLMFAGLLNYTKEEYYKQHPDIQIYSLEEKMDYKVCAAFHIAADKNNKFMFQEYQGHMEEDEYNNYVEEIKKRRLYDTEVTPHYGNALLTLVTCSYNTKNERFVVVATRTEREE